MIIRLTLFLAMLFSVVAKADLCSWLFTSDLTKRGAYAWTALDRAVEMANAKLPRGLRMKNIEFKFDEGVLAEDDVTGARAEGERELRNRLQSVGVIYESPISVRFYEKLAEIEVELFAYYLPVINKAKWQSHTAPQSLEEVMEDLIKLRSTHPEMRADPKLRSYAIALLSVHYVLGRMEFQLPTALVFLRNNFRRDRNSIFEVIQGLKKIGVITDIDQVEVQKQLDHSLQVKLRLAGFHHRWTWGYSAAALAELQKMAMNDGTRTSEGMQYILDLWGRYTLP